MHPPPPAGCTGMAPPDPPLTGVAGRGCGAGAGTKPDMVPTFDEALAARKVLPSPNGSMPPPTYANPKARTARPPQEAIADLRCPVVTNVNPSRFMCPIPRYFPSCHMTKGIIRTNCGAWLGRLGCRCTTEQTPQWLGAPDGISAGTARHRNPALAHCAPWGLVAPNSSAPGPFSI